MMRRSEPLAARLGAVVLGFEAIVAFLGGLVIYGLHGLPFSLEPWWGIVGGAVLALLMMLAAGATRFRWGIVFGWILQFVVLACALLNPAFILVFLVFGGMWAYAMITSAKIARGQRAAVDQTESE